MLALPGCTGIATTADYIVPWSLGGTLADGLRGACAHCNSARGNRPLRYRQVTIDEAIAHARPRAVGRGSTTTHGSDRWTLGHARTKASPNPEAGT